MTFDGSTIDGFSRVQESDVLAMPDAKTFQLLPYMAEESPVARVVCDVANLDGSPFDDPRHVLRRALERARSLGSSSSSPPSSSSSTSLRPTTLQSDRRRCRSTAARTST